MTTAKEEWDALPEDEKNLRMEAALTPRLEKKHAIKPDDTNQEALDKIVAKHVEAQETAKEARPDKFLPHKPRMTEPPLSRDEIPDLHVPGAKDDSTKVRMDLVFSDFPRALEAFGKVATMGAEKYTDGGWLHVLGAEKRYFAAMQRHFLAHMMKEENDPESKLPHLAHAAWNAMAILELHLRNQDSKPSGLSLTEKAFRENNDFRNLDHENGMGVNV